MTSSSRHGAQLVASLLVAVVIVAVVIAAVTARLGPTSVAELEAREDRRDLLEDRRDDRNDRREDRLEGWLDPRNGARLVLTVAT